MKKTLLVLLLAVLVIGCKKNSTAAFTIDSYTYTVKDEVKFTNLSTNAKSYRWDFGDGSRSTEESPTHNYPHPGIYRVTLVADGSSEMSKDLQVTAE